MHALLRERRKEVEAALAALPPPPQQPAAAPPPRLDATRLLPPKDFERLQRMKAARSEGSALKGAKRKRAEAEMLREEEEEARALMARGGAAVEGEEVDE
ncbi:MAG: hypothetical protein VYB24_08280, partial [Pseudomonadota bacterium]|nr:hypothetical protein [Pseudomonadota bacterium]